MAKKLLEGDIKRKAKNFLRSQGKNIGDLTEGELTELYWNIISNNIVEAEKRTVTTYSPEDETDDVSDAVKRADDEDISYNDDGTISVKEDEIMDMMGENQNPIMSKNELIQEMSRQIVNEDNKYEGEYDSGDNDYSRHLDTDSVKDMGNQLYQDIKSAAEEKFGRANFQTASMAMAQSLQNILMFEQGKEQELQDEAIQLIRDEYPSLTEDAVDIDAQITGHPQLGGRPITKGNVQLSKGNKPVPEGYTEDELKDEVTKRRLINGLTHGAARKGQNLYHMASEKLNQINPRATQDYSKVMAANDFMYWAIDRETINDQSSNGEHVGNVRVVIQESGKPKIIAQGMTFSFVLHELTKGVMELMSLHGTHEDKGVRDYVEDKTDTLEAEADDIRLGTGIWEKVSRFVEIENPNHKAVFLNKLITKPANEFVGIMKGLMKNDPEMVEVIQSIAEEASEELRNEEYEDAMGTYDEPSGDEEGDVADGDENVPDDELDNLLGGNDDELDYSEMDITDLRKAMDDALDNGDYGLAKEIGKYLN